MRTRAEWNGAKPGFVEIDLVGHEGGNSQGEFCFTLDFTDIATGWTETVSVKNKAQKWVFAAFKTTAAKYPFPILGIDSDNGTEFINWELFRWCEQEELTFTRSRSENNNCEDYSWVVWDWLAVWVRPFHPLVVARTRIGLWCHSVDLSNLGVGRRDPSGPPR